MTPWVWIICGTLTLALGGMAATYGWNLRSAQASARTRIEEVQRTRQAMLHTLASEVAIDLVTLKDASYTESDEAKLSKFVVYPSLRHQALAAALASNLFTGESDRELFTRITDLHNRIAAFNDKMNISHMWMLHQSKPAEVADFRRKAADLPLLINLKEKLIGFAVFLGQTYKVDPLDPKSSFFIELK